MYSYEQHAKKIRDRRINAVKTVLWSMSIMSIPLVLVLIANHTLS